MINVKNQVNYKDFIIIYFIWLYILNNFHNRKTMKISKVYYLFPMESILILLLKIKESLMFLLSVLWNLISADEIEEDDIEGNKPFTVEEFRAKALEKVEINVFHQ